MVGQGIVAVAPTHHHVRVQVEPDCMKSLIGPLLRAMHRLAKEHNQAPALGLLSAKADQPVGCVC